MDVTELELADPERQLRIARFHRGDPHQVAGRILADPQHGCCEPPPSACGDQERADPDRVAGIEHSQQRAQAVVCSIGLQQDAQSLAGLALLYGQELTFDISPAHGQHIGRALAGEVGQIHGGLTLRRDLLIDKSPYCVIGVAVLRRLSILPEALAGILSTREIHYFGD